MISVGFKVEEDKINRSYFCRLMGKTALGQDIAVTGLLSEGYNLQSTSNYDQPLLDFTVGQKVQAVGAIAQAMTEGMTSQTLANSIQVYQNESPIMTTLPLSFMALRDPVNEVSKAERYLMEMKAPQLAKGALLEAQGKTDIAAVMKVAQEYLSPTSFMKRLKNSHRPGLASAVIAKHIMFPEILISDVEIQHESVNHKSGISAGMVINVTIVFQRTMNNSEFAKLFPS